MGGQCLSHRTRQVNEAVLYICVYGKPQQQARHTMGDPPPCTTKPLNLNMLVHTYTQVLYGARSHVHHSAHCAAPPPPHTAPASPASPCPPRCTPTQIHAHLHNTHHSPGVHLTHITLPAGLGASASTHTPKRGFSCNTQCTQQHSMHAYAPGDVRTSITSYTMAASWTQQPLSTHPKSTTPCTTKPCWHQQ
jgi:hypothetical protein